MGATELVDLTTGLLLVALFVATMWRPAVAYAGVTSVFALEQWAQASGQFFAVHSQVINYSVGLTVLLGLGVSLARGRNPLRDVSTVQLMIYALLGFAVLSTLWSIARQSTLNVLWYMAPYILANTIALPFVFNDEDDYRDALVATALLGCIVIPALVFGTSIHAWGRTIEAAQVIVDRYGVERSRLNPLAIASYAGTVALILVAGRFGRKRASVRYVGWAVVVMGVFLIVRSESRGQLIALVLTALLVARFSYPGKHITSRLRFFVVASALALAVFFVFRFFYADGVRTNRWSLEVLEGTYSSTRGVMCQRLLDSWLNSSPVNLLLGLGSAASWSKSINGTYPHVQIVEILGELGFVGFAIAMGLLWSVFRASREVLKLTASDIEKRTLAVSYIAIIVFFGILSFKQGSFLTSYRFYFNAAILGRYVLLLRRTRRKQYRMAQTRAALTPPRMLQPVG